MDLGVIPIITGVVVPIFLAFIGAIQVKVREISSRLSKMEQDINSINILIAKESVSRSDIYPISRELNDTTRSVAVAHSRIDRLDEVVNPYNHRQRKNERSVRE